MLSVTTDFFVAEPVLLVGAILEERLKKPPKRGPVVASASDLMLKRLRSLRDFLRSVGRHALSMPMLGSTEVQINTSSSCHVTSKYLTLASREIRMIETAQTLV